MRFRMKVFFTVVFFVVFIYMIISIIYNALNVYIFFLGG
jgi:hypothetical protein